jgi:hypothetical protein
MVCIEVNNKFVTVCIEVNINFVIVYAMGMVNKGL